ncbi:predicted nuclease of the RNAse H fold, HicB family [Thermodesulfovibrio aggregans]|uniref:Predicted nuclease of the RNAse H fold, HicB family n=1 Tax=Thermodesulfovibrio aggregans TaxID=86166 RepID=A0A0U9HWI2_9BACT|nr:type II toxin-antitoxin system HicB family antitoxin [Thermodesulfovibrio aggregans]GAQ95149.1 predicted nuclease of the RNAse H fold, HicB family [Thermodesulfovibrio aggregans]
MYRYEIIIYWSEEDEAFIAEVPELPGCMADSKTYEEAVNNVKVVIEEWIETAKSLGREIPQPKGKLAFA